MIRACRGKIIVAMAGIAVGVCVRVVIRFVTLGTADATVPQREGEKVMIEACTGPSVCIDRMTGGAISGESRLGMVRIACSKVIGLVAICTVHSGDIETQL